jgi:hypothetical protein
MSRERIFTKQDLAAVATASDTLREFRRFLAARFIAWAQTPGATADDGAPLDVPDANGRTSAGYGQWRLDERSAYGSPPAYRFEHWLSGDRGGSDRTQTASVPAEFVFATGEEGAEYALYLSLKDRFEPKA